MVVEAAAVTDPSPTEVAAIVVVTLVLIAWLGIALIPTSGDARTLTGRPVMNPYCNSVAGRVPDAPPGGPGCGSAGVSDRGGF